MKKTIFLAIILLLTLTSISFAQGITEEFERRQEQTRQREAALQQAANASPSAKTLKAKVDAQESDVILEAAKTGDQSLKPYLKLLAADKERRSRNGSAAFQAHIALAKLGDKEVLPEIFAELNASEVWVQDAAIAKLARIGGKEAYRKLYELLDDMTNRDKIIDDDVIRPKAFTVMRQLGEVVENPPRFPNGLIQDLEVAPWKAWFAKNKHLIE